MKKIFIILLILIASVEIRSQTIYSKFATNQIVKGVVEDTTMYLTISNQFIGDQYQWLIWIDYSLLSGDSVVVTVQMSGNLGSSWTDYKDGSYTKTLTGTSGTEGFEDSMITGDYLRLKVSTGKTDGSLAPETCKFNAWIRATPIKKY